jgi:hypothetical protein
LFPLTLYYFAREVSGRTLARFTTGFVVILPIGIFLPLRVKLGLLSEDGAHAASLTFTPIVCLLLLRFLRRGNFWEGIFSALGTTVVALTSPLGLVVLSVFMGVITFSEMLLGQGRLKAIRFFVVLFLAAGFSSFWYNPKFALLTLNSPQGQLVERALANLLPPSFFLLPLLGVFGFLLFENRPQLQPMFIAFFLTIGFGLFSLGAGLTHPTPSRFLLAFGISIAFLVGVLMVGLFDFLRFSPQLNRFKKIVPYRQKIAIGAIVAFFAMIIIIIASQAQAVWRLHDTYVLGLTSEHKVGAWEIKEQTSQAERMFGLTITGLTILSAGHWLDNSFSWPNSKKNPKILI